MSRNKSEIFKNKAIHIIYCAMRDENVSKDELYKRVQSAKGADMPYGTFRNYYNAARGLFNKQLEDYQDYLFGILWAKSQDLYARATESGNFNNIAAAWDRQWAFVQGYDIKSSGAGQIKINIITDGEAVREIDKERTNNDGE